MLTCADWPDFVDVPAGSSIFMKLGRNACGLLLCRPDKKCLKKFCAHLLVFAQFMALSRR